MRSFNYVEQVKGPDHEKYLWTSASFSFASNMVKSFINNGWCVQIRGPQAGGAVKDLPIHLYDLGIGAGNQAGGADAANLLKPALARGELRTIAATTWSEYKQYFERDAALERRFQMVKVDEPDDDTACLMLRGLKSRYAQHHGVHITDEAVRAAVTLSRRYLTGRQLPDKAVDLLDTASARVRMSLDTVPETLTRMKAQLTALAMEKQALMEDIAVGNITHDARLVAIEQDEVRIILELDEREAQYGQELKLTEALMACRADISRQAEIAGLQQQLSEVQQGNWAITPACNLQHHNKETDVLRTSLIKPACWLPALLAFSLTGCGMTQGITDGTKSAFNAVFYKKIKVLHLDFTAREALNTDSRESNSLSEPVVVRVYQLKDRKTFDKTVYQQLLKDGETILKADLLASRDVVVKPGGDVSLDMPMEEGAKFVAVVGLFRHPDMVNNTWKQVLRREDLDPDKPRILEAGNNHLTLQPRKDD